MPRDGSGVASQPAGTAAVTNTTVSSTKFNSVVSDIYSLLNSGINPESVDLNGGAIDGATIGGSVPAPGAFSTLIVQSWPEGTIASAATTDIGAETEYRLNVTGTVTITSLGTETNSRKQLRFSDVLTLTHNATSLILPGGADITTAAGDIFYFESDATGNWRCTSYLPAEGYSTSIASIDETTEPGSLILDIDSGDLVASSRLLIKIDGTNVFELDASGNVRIAGDWTTGETIT